MKILKIDGSFGEGGGQILRTSLALSVIAKTSIQIERIRANRKKPGLRPQHLMACHAVAAICKGTLEGASLGSTSIQLFPGKIQGGEYTFDIGTAGSVILLAQALIPICLFASKSSHIRIFGGTHVMKSPNYDYFDKIFLPAIRQLGAVISSKLIRVGYYPKGGGSIEFEVTPNTLRGCNQWGKSDTLSAIIRISRLPLHITQREKAVLLQHQVHNIEISEDDSFSPGNVITLWQSYRGASVLGERGKPAEKVALEVVELFRQENSNVDYYLADQLLIYAALAKGDTAYSTSQISDHLRTNRYVLAQFIDKKIEFKDNTVSIQD
jgi:RNA 3'-terminal phosphate cyclase (ATP)